MNILVGSCIVFQRNWFDPATYLYYIFSKVPTTFTVQKGLENVISHNRLVNRNVRFACKPNIDFKVTNTN